MEAIIIKKKLDSGIIKLGKKAESLIGKNVEIVIRELISHKPSEKKWRHLGTADLNGVTDHLNIREFAHDD